ncbi:MAG: hypothetical protein ACYC6Q_03125 [Syntrophales bacterium]
MKTKTEEIQSNPLPFWITLEERRGWRQDLPVPVERIDKYINKYKKQEIRKKEDD